jgi:hypothetical protein
VVKYLHPYNKNNNIKGVMLDAPRFYPYLKLKLKDACRITIKKEALTG